MTDSAASDCSACRGDECADLRCPKSQRPCGHHCNCVMIHDHCHWCGLEWGEEVTAQRFRKKPVEIDAVQWDGTAQAAGPIIDWILTGDHTARYHEPDLDFEPKVPPRIAITTLEGTMNADPNDWIIRGVKGEFYPCKPDIFETTYEPV